MSKMTKKHKLMAYVLNKDESFHYSQKKIASLMDVTQSTISNAVKEVEYLREIKGLKEELLQARSILKEQGILPSPSPMLLKS